MPEYDGRRIIHEALKKKDLETLDSSIMSFRQLTNSKKR